MSKTSFPTLRTAAVIVAVTAAILCLLTMSRTFGFIDSGEMAAAASTLGIPHPTGYPLLMILGHAAVVVLPVREVLALNILAALMVGAGAGVLVLLFHHVLTRLLSQMRPQEEGTPSRAGSAVPYAACGALLTVLTPIWWSTGTGFEAYALHALLLPLILYTFLRYIDSETEPRGGKKGKGKEKHEVKFRITRGAFFFSLVLGLSFSNHLTTIILAPALLGWFFYRFGFGRDTWMRLLSFVPGFILGLLPYLYLPIRSASNPALNWGMPTSADRFFAHVSGTQFTQYMFDFSVPGKQLGWYFASLPAEFAYVGLLLAVIGLVVLLRNRPPVAVLSGVLFLTCIFYAGTYAIKEIEPYFMAATLVVGLWGTIGLMEIGRRFGSAIALSTGGLALVLAGILNWGAVDRSDDVMAEQLARTMLITLPKNSVLLTTRWDVIYSGALYLQSVEHLRPDVSIINTNMLSDRVYLSQVLDRNPSFKKVSARIREFVNERKIFDLRPEIRRQRNVPYQTAFYRMINGIISTCGRPVMVTPEVDSKIGYGWNRIPHRLALLLTPDSTYVRENLVRYPFSLPSRRMDPDVMSTSLFYANALVTRARYEVAHGDTAVAARRVAQARMFDPAIDPDDIPVLPMGNRKFVADGVRFFKSIEK